MQKIKKYFSDLKSFNFNLFISLCLLALVPAVYQTVRTFLISTSTSTGAFDVIGQMEWFDLINETLLAFLIVPLYSVLNKIYENHRERFTTSVFKVGLISFALYFVFSIVVFIYGVYLVKLMNPAEIDIDLVNTYLQLETVAFIIGIVSRFVNVVFVVVGKARNVYIFLIANAVLSVLADFVLIPAFEVMGVALSNILINLILGIAGILLLVIQKHIKPEKFSKQDICTCKEWARVGIFSGLQQFIDNIFYAVMIGKMVNMVAEQGNYWVANNFIWGWLLLPVLQLGELIKQETAIDKDNIRKNSLGYFGLTAIISALWFISIPFWKPFMANILQFTDVDKLFELVLVLVGFYVLYAFQNIFDSIFYGLGKTNYMLFESVVTNTVYYGIAFILYLTGIWTPSLIGIALLFGIGNAFDSVVSLAAYAFLLRKEKINVLKVE